MTTAPNPFGDEAPRWQDQSIPMVRRRNARSLMDKVEALTENLTPIFPEHAKRVESYARSIGAHSVARAVYWYRCTDPTIHGEAHMSTRALRVARAYLARQEAL